ncbi:TPA: fructosamine kinase family protein [Staphylococcus aureus]|nr:fructosamine kinase family protein [Staphylococcus aureus]HAR4953764.1 fructosamine kinase family protein [Staphylococcus aureus]
MYNFDYSKLPIKNIQKIFPIAGGYVNLSFSVDASNKKYFLKLQPNTKSNFFDYELSSLKELTDKNIPVPQIINKGELDNNSFLLLEFIENGHAYPESYRKLGKIVANMHKNINSLNLFGFSHNFNGGTIEFTNKWTSSWGDLFIKSRMDKLCSEIYKKRLFSISDLLLYEDIRKIMLKSLYYHQSSPSLLHGDLWKGNMVLLQSKKYS